MAELHFGNVSAYIIFISKDCVLHLIIIMGNGSAQTGSIKVVCVY